MLPHQYDCWHVIGHTVVLEALQAGGVPGGVAALGTGGQNLRGRARGRRGQGRARGRATGRVRGRAPGRPPGRATKAQQAPKTAMEKESFLWEIGPMEQTIGWLHQRINEILLGTGDGTCKTPNQDGMGIHCPSSAHLGDT